MSHRGYIFRNRKLAESRSSGAGDMSRRSERSLFAMGKSAAALPGDEYTRENPLLGAAQTETSPYMEERDVVIVGGGISGLAV